MIAQGGRLEISRSRLLENIALLRGRLGATTVLCATLKANAYGHGVEPMCELLRDAGIDWAGVYSLDEARELATIQAAERLKLLVLAPLVAEAQNLLTDIVPFLDGTKVRINVTDEATARALSWAVVDRDDDARSGVKVHVQIDTGLTRAGADPSQTEKLIELITKLPGLTMEGVFAHFSHADMPGHATVAEQAKRFHAVVDPLKKRFPHLLVHLQNSAGALHWTDDSLDMARIGIALYGLQPSMAHRVAGLRPIARLTAPILALHEAPANTGVGYGHTFVTRRHSRLGVVPVGYGDGYPRALSNAAAAQICEPGGREVDVPLVGRVSMDQVIVDVTDHPQVGVGHSVTLISWNPENRNSIDRIADATGTIGYEIATHMGARLKRVIVD